MLKNRNVVFPLEDLFKSPWTKIVVRDHLHFYFLQFRTGAFSTGNTVQPVALRLSRFSIEDSTLVLKWSYSTFSNRFPNWVDTLTWARYQSRSPKLLFLQTLLTPVNSPVKSFVIKLTLFSGDICVHWILACCHSNGGGAFGPKTLLRSGECLSLFTLLPFFLCFVDSDRVSAFLC